MLFAEMTRLVAMSGATAKPGIREAVRNRVASRICLVAGCECQATRRGLCGKHYMAYLRELQSRPKKDRPDFEATAIREGRILAAHEARQLRSPNPFSDL